jgi:hypothetical protein
MPRICESCGAAFGCGGAVGSCWCTAFTVTEHALDEIRAKFDDCLCPACLAEYSSGPAAAEKGGPPV